MEVMMKTQKILLKTAYCVAGMIIFTSIGFNIFQYQRIKKLSENAAPKSVTKEESTDSPMTAPVKMVQENKNMEPAVKDTNMSDINELEYQLEAAEEELDMVSEELSEELDKKKDFKNATAQLQKTIASSPNFRKSLKNSLLQSIDSDYALLYERLDLSPEQLEGFKSIVGAWRVDNMDTTDLVRVASTDEEKEAAYRQRQLKRDKYKKQFIELMGEEKFNTYNNFRMSRFDRDTLDRFIQTLPPENRIDNAVMDNLIDRMYEARTSIEKAMGFYDTIHFSSDMNEKTASREIDMAAQVYRKYAEIGSDILPPEQAEQYKAYIAQESERYISQVKMREFLLGGKTNKSSDEEISD
jgi:hypothetical protein